MNSPINDMSTLRLAKYPFQGGVLNFSVPRPWLEEFTEDGDMVCFLEREDSPVLRVSIITMQAPPGEKELSPQKVLASIDVPGLEPVAVKIPVSMALGRLVELVEEEGVPLKIHHWYLAHVVPPRYAHVALFSYSYLQSQQGDCEIEETADLLEDLIAKARFTR